MCLNSGRRSENLVGTHASTGRICKLCIDSPQLGGGFELRTFCCKTPQRCFYMSVSLNKTLLKFIMDVWRSSAMDWPLLRLSAFDSWVTCNLSRVIRMDSWMNECLISFFLSPDPGEENISVLEMERPNMFASGWLCGSVKCVFG